MVIMPLRFFLIILTISLLGWQFVHADTVVSPEGAALSQLSTAMKVYTILHNGQQARTWTQLREVFDLDAANKNLRGKPSYPLEAHYEFLTKQVPLIGYPGSEVVMIRTVPLQRAEGAPKWRYLIGQTKDGDLSATRLPEETVQAMFSQAGVAPPLAKAGLPAVEIEAMPHADEPVESTPAGRESADGKRSTPALPLSAVHTITDASSQPAAPVTQTSTATAESRAPVWPWVIGGILALIVIVAVVLKRRS